MPLNLTSTLSPISLVLPSLVLLSLALLSLAPASSLRPLRFSPPFYAIGSLVVLLQERQLRVLLTRKCYELFN